MTRVHHNPEDVTENGSEDAPHFIAHFLQYWNADHSTQFAANLVVFCRDGLAENKKPTPRQHAIVNQINQNKK
jgi:hypothetical protein